MDRFEWNGLRPGDAVVVHAHPDLGLVEGHVLSVARSRRRNDVGVRMVDGTARWPTSAEVHVLPRRDDAGRCWRCSSRRSAASGAGTPTP